MMPRRIDEATLQAALVGFAVELEKVNQRIAEIQKKLGHRATAPVSVAGGKPRRKISAAAIERIRKAQKKRWAAFHRQQKSEKPAAKKAAPKKRTLSPEAKAKLAANLAKARAAKAAKKAA